MRIASLDDGQAHVVIVSDDGVGFDEHVLAGSGDGRAHIGIQNVRVRLAEGCRGTLEVTSAPGAGTTATIRIPHAPGDREGARL